MKCVAMTIAAAGFAAAMGWSYSALAAMGGGAFPGPGIAYTVPPLQPAWSDQYANPPAGTYCATPTRTCSLHRAGYAGDPCSCHARGGRELGRIVPQ